MSTTSLPNGNDALLDVLELGDIMRLIEKTARWVDPATFNLLPIWYPEYSRRSLLYNKKWSEPRMNTNRKTKIATHKSEGNTNANKALTQALGLRSEGRKNWSCCHIWGVDDPTYQEANVIVQDHRYFSCVANMILLPTPLKTFTDTMPKVKKMLRICARNLYGWHCDHPNMRTVINDLDNWQDWNNYPESWPRKKDDSLPKGIMTLDQNIIKNAERRWKAIQGDIQNAGKYFPRDEVKKALVYWRLNPKDPLKQLKSIE